MTLEAFDWLKRSELMGLSLGLGLLLAVLFGGCLAFVAFCAYVTGPRLEERL